MVFALLAVLVIGLALYETGYGVTNTWLKSLRKQAIVQTSAAAAFFISGHFFLPSVYTSTFSLFVNLGFLSMLAYIATATIRSCYLTAAASAIVGGVLFPIMIDFAGPNGYFVSIEYVDAAGAGIVHFVGGIVALIASMYTSKIKRSDLPIVIRPYSATLGFLILWAGWIAYIGIISLPVLQSVPDLWIKGLVNLSTATAWGALAAVCYMYSVCGQVKMRTCTVGGLAGMVAMSADPFTVPFWGAAVIGMLGGLLATWTYGILCRFKVLDPSNAISIHMLPGLIGVLLVPIFHHGAHFTSQIVGLSVLALLASSMGVVICELHNLTKTHSQSPR